MFELPSTGTISRFGFDTARANCAGRGAKHVVVEVSATSKDAGLETVLKAALADRRDGRAFADSNGSADYSELMGLRAWGSRSVQEYLAGKGVAASRLASEGFSQSRPVADNATELGRAQNRRFELVKK